MKHLNAVWHALRAAERMADLNDSTDTEEIALEAMIREARQWAENLLKNPKDPQAPVEMEINYDADSSH